MRNEGEPSVEEILESIKKVIARDNRELPRAPRLRDAPPPAAPEEQPEHFALEESEGEEDEVLDLGKASELVDGPGTGPKTDDGLTTEASARSMRESLAALAMMSEPGARPQIVRSGETSLEGLVREMLRPMLAQWLDENLPGMVERLVKAEISRIARKQP